MSKQKLENIIGTLAYSYKQLNPKTIQHSHEIMNQRYTDESLRDQWFYTADFPLYSIENGKVYLNMATRENNLIFRHIDEATQQLVKENNYFPSKKEADKVAKAKSTLKVDLSELTLIKDNDEWGYFNISTTNYDKLNKTERALAERSYSSGKDFKKNMEMLDKAGIKETQIYVLNESYVKANAKDGYLGRASWLDRFDFVSRFFASNRNVGYSYGYGGGLRGVLKGAEGAKKTKAFKTGIPKQSEIFGIFAPYLGSANKKETKQKLEELFNKYNN